MPKNAASNSAASCRNPPCCGMQAVRHLPAAVGGEARDGVGAVEQQPPQPFRRVHAARIAAAHRDRSRSAPRRRRRSGSAPAGRVLPVTWACRCSASRSGVGKSKVSVVASGIPAAMASRLAELDRAQRVEPEVAERPPGCRPSPASGWPSTMAALRPHGVEHGAWPSAPRQPASRSRSGSLRQGPRPGSACVPRRADRPRPAVQPVRRRWKA